MDAIPDHLVPFELTFALHDGSMSSKMLALCSLSPAFIMVGFATLCVFHRHMYIYWFVAGQLVNVLLNDALKALIDAPRPEGTWRADGGMPSNHAQFMAFFSTYAIILLYTRLSLGCGVVLDWAAGLAFAGLAASVMFSRVEQGYHTVEQVLVGEVVGVGFALVWRLLVCTVNARVVEFMQPVLAKLCIVEHTAHENERYSPCRVEYQRAQKRGRHAD